MAQYGIRIDALIHLVGNRRYLEELGLKELALPLTILDYSREVAQNSDFIVSHKHLEGWEQQYGCIEADTFIALHTGWSKRWPDIGKFEDKDVNGRQHSPSWDLGVLKFLIEERGIRSIGYGTFDTDASIGTARNDDIIGERHILGQGTFQVELLTNLDRLPARGAIICAVSPKPKDASGSPTRVPVIRP